MLYTQILQNTDIGKDNSTCNFSDSEEDSFYQLCFCFFWLSQPEQSIVFVCLKVFCFVLTNNDYGESRLRWQEGAYWFLSNDEANTRKEITEITSFWATIQTMKNFGRYRIHISCRLSSKYIFWLCFLGIDLLLIDTSFLFCDMEIWKSAFFSASAQLSCAPKEAELSQCALEKHQQDRHLWTFLRDRSSLPVIKWAYASCPKQYFHKGRGWQFCTYHTYRVYGIQFSWLKHKHPLSLLSA